MQPRCNKANGATMALVNDSISVIDYGIVKKTLVETLEWERVVCMRLARDVKDEFLTCTQDNNIMSTTTQQECVSSLLKKRR